MRASRGPCRRSHAIALAVAVVALALIAGPGLARAGGTRRAPSRAIEPSSEAAAIIDGRVVDVDGKAVAGVTVLATRAQPDGRVHPRVESDRDGRFHFALPPGEYVFVALHRHLAGLTPAMRVLQALEVVLVVTPPSDAA